MGTTSTNGLPFASRRALGAFTVGAILQVGCSTDILGAAPGGDSGGPPPSTGGASSAGGGSGAGGTTAGSTSTGGGNTGGTTATGGASGSAGSGGEPVAFAPAPGAYRRLTNAAFRNSLRDLLDGPVDVGDLEPDSWSIGGLPTVGAALVSISQRGVEQYQSAIEAVTTQVFADTARRDRILGCRPANATDATCFRQFVTSFGRRAFRRALTEAQITLYTELITTTAATLGDVYGGVRSGMIGMLVSPHFLYRLERGAAGSSGSGFWQYTSTEMASRLSYFLTNSTPDATLLDVAEQDGLGTADAVREHASRLLETQAGRESVRNFATELFQLPIIGARAKDPALYPEYTPGLQAAMMEEIPAMLAGIVFDRNASALDLFTTRETFANAELAKLYGLPTAGRSTVLTPATLPAEGLRAGLLGTAGIMSLYASQKEGSPTQRGKFIREVLLCEIIPAPPPDVDTTLEDPPSGEMLTKREKLEQHLTVDSCRGCHAALDPLGLTLENFDAIGKYRTMDHGKPIDVTGDLDEVPFSGPVELGQLLAAAPRTAACLVRNIYRYGTGHVEVASEAPVVNDLTARFQASGYNVKQLMLDLVTSDGFRYVAPPEP
jgi:hypothetical protein